MRFAIFAFIILLAGCLQQAPPPNASEDLNGFQDKMDSMEDRLDEMQEKIDFLEEQLNGEEAPAAQEPEAPAAGVIKFKVTVQNVHASRTLSSGVFIVHRKLANLNPLGKSASTELAALAEDGDASLFHDYAQNQTGVFRVYSIDSLGPGESVTLTIDAPKDRPRETSLSGIMGISGTGDGFAMADSITLFTDNDQPIGSLSKAQNYDAGTSEGGSPTVPQRPVILSTQVPGTILQVSVAPQ